jgi:multiple sugar transport system substrate-binding protein
LRAFPNTDVKTQELNDVQGQTHTFDVYQINEQDVPQFLTNAWVQPFTGVDATYKEDPAIYSYSNIGRWNSNTKSFDASGQLMDLPLLGNVDIFVYRKDIYDKLGLSAPTTWDQVIENGKKIAAANAAKYGGVFRTQGTPGAYSVSFEFQALLNSAGGGWFTAPGTNFTPVANSAPAVKAATWLRELAKLGPSATTTLGQAQVIASLQAGDAAQSYLVAAAAAQLEDAANSNVLGKIGYAPLPPAADGSSSSATGLWSLAIPAGLPKDRAKAALDYITWMTSQKAMTLFAQYGGIPTRSDAFNPPGVSDATKAALAAVQQTAAKLPATPTSLRYSFSGDVLNVTEPGLANIAAGQVSPSEGMNQIQSGLTSVVKKDGLAAG